MLRTFLIAAHAVSGIAALVCGVLALRPPTPKESPTFRWYLGTLWAMVLFLIVVLATDWTDLDVTNRIIYGALSLFALYIGWRGWRAYQDLHHPRQGWSAAYIDNVGFTLIALFDGFVIIAALDLRAPVWLVILIGVVGVLIGRFALREMKLHAAHAVRES